MSQAPVWPALRPLHEARRWPKAGVGASDDLPTVAGVPYDEDDEPGTVPAVAWAALAVTAPDGRKSHFSLTKPVVTIGRSRNAGNDLVLDSDGMVPSARAPRTGARRPLDALRPGQHQRHQGQRPPHRGQPRPPRAATRS